MGTGRERLSGGEWICSNVLYLPATYLYCCYRDKGFWNHYFITIILFLAYLFLKKEDLQFSSWSNSTKYSMPIQWMRQPVNSWKNLIILYWVVKQTPYKFKTLEKLYLLLRQKQKKLQDQQTSPKLSAQSLMTKFHHSDFHFTFSMYLII